MYSNTRSLAINNIYKFFSVQIIIPLLRTREIISIAVDVLTPWGRGELNGNKDVLEELWCWGRELQVTYIL
jgi:hypothetical protein